MNRNPPKNCLAARRSACQSERWFNCPLRYLATAESVIGRLQRLLSVVWFTYCVIFATLQNLFFIATVQGDFFSWMSRIYYRLGGAFMKSLVIKRSVVVAGHKTSVSLEDAFWKGLKEIAHARDLTLSELVGAIDSEREYGNLSSALRLFVLEFYRSQISDLKEGRGGSDQGSESSGAVRIRRMAQARH